MTEAQVVTIVLRLALFVVPLALIHGLVRFSRWRADRNDPIEAEIKKRGARICVDRQGNLMDKADPTIMKRVADARWQEALSGQIRTRRQESVVIVELPRIPRDEEDVQSGWSVN